MKPKNGRFTRGPRSFSASLFLERLTRGFRSFSVALFVFFKFAFGAVYTGTPFFIRFQCGAVLYFRCMALYERRFGFAVSWLCECRLSHLGGGVNKKNTLPSGRPAKVEPAGARVRGAGEPQSGGQ